MDADRGKRESYYGKYAGTVKRLGVESQIVDSTGFAQNLVNSIPEFTTGQVVGGTKTALGVKPAPQKDTSTTHKMTLEVTSSKVVAIIDGKELSDCGYQVGVVGGGVARLIAGDMDFSAVIGDSTPDGKVAKTLLISLSDGPGNGGTLKRV
ncbi:hypothetical protein SAMN04488074_102557 [Lentzea albidocapillata subsp. violacea]|uniref:Uncharacterized protein n=1 Tax=Lentzea albidocapillata subsp. violacea TaxID=128104 RepID=A0A1G8VBB6_9PSEU|nr:hypothetical protein [Lentzea albidocapillata]SDJ62645.1 hypothetical protein SAMN04488074_102557 [Lentzea albidocapillata subsp. violacea]